MNERNEREYCRFFSDATGFPRPYDWQVRIALDGLPEVLPIPTGLGKTEGAVLAWAWRKLSGYTDEPLHLIYCLPMRTLVTQTVKRLRECFEALGSKRAAPEIAVFQLMGGVIDDAWASAPDRPWVLVGTQDQLLSRALNRGYGMSRFEWPVHFGLLNQDCHWIVDEVQLMGPGLWTTSQLDWMRRKRFASLKPCRTTWMSATVGEDFLATTDRKKAGIDTVQPFEPELDKDDALRLRRSAIRRVEWFKPLAGKRAAPVNEQIGKKVLQEHREGTLSLVVCNTVQDAQDVFRSLPSEPPKILLTSRFRRGDRHGYEQELLEFEARRSKSESGRIDGDPGLICVSTQVVEAGIDVSAHRLWPQLAPWPSTIQRLGRLNRDGRDPNAIAFFWQPTKGKEQKRDGDVFVGPYSKRDLDAAKVLFDRLRPLASNAPFSVALTELQRSEPDLVKRALQPKPSPLPRALDVHGLFSTERDLHGGFTDVSAFVRDADPDADVSVFWRVWKGVRPPSTDILNGPPFDSNAEGCQVALYSLQHLLASRHARAWIWNDEDERWEICPAGDLRPGMTVMLHRDVGGYHRDVGWTGDGADTLTDVPVAGPGRMLTDDQRTQFEYYVPVDEHLNDAQQHAKEICDALGLTGDLLSAVVEAAAHHDLGKVHPKWQSALPAAASVQGGPWAKCPHVIGFDVPSADAFYGEELARLREKALPMPPLITKRGLRLRWIVDRKLTRKELDTLNSLPKVRWAGHVPFRPGLRHEAASALAMWARYREGIAPYPALAVYLAAAHHGKVRTVLRSVGEDGGDIFGVPPRPDTLAAKGQVWPLDFSLGADGSAGEWTERGFVLTDHGWTGLLSDLLGPWRDCQEDLSDVGVVPEHEPQRLGPFALAWLEALVRVADWRASANPSKRTPLPGGIS